MRWRFATSGYAEVRLQSSGLRYTSSVWPWPGAPKVRICTVQRIGLCQVLENTHFLSAMNFTKAIAIFGSVCLASFITAERWIDGISVGHVDGLCFPWCDFMDRMDSSWFRGRIYSTYTLIPAKIYSSTHKIFPPFFVSRCIIFYVVICTQNGRRMKTMSSVCSLLPELTDTRQENTPTSLFWG